MSQASKMILVAVIAALISGGGIYLWQTKESSELPSISSQDQELNESETTTKSTAKNEFAGVAKYNCEKSGGKFLDNNCKCNWDETADQSINNYDKSTGYCQSDIGGPAGDAFAASIGLPYGDYSFYNSIVMNNCTETGGEFLYSCDCPNQKIYDELTGYCK